tara:strand:+ start:306 stop:461 length:156 start_codon:yes stop_codon:yes gene_type:complete
MCNLLTLFKLINYPEISVINSIINRSEYRPGLAAKVIRYQLSFLVLDGQNS